MKDIEQQTIHEQENKTGVEISQSTCVPSLELLSTLEVKKSSLTLSITAPLAATVTVAAGNSHPIDIQHC